MNTNQNSPDLTFPQLQGFVQNALRGVAFSRLAGGFVIASIIFNLARVQNAIPGLHGLFLPAIFGGICGVLYLTRARDGITKATKLLLVFLAVEAARIVFGKLVWEEFVRNDGHAFAMWRDILQQVLAYVFPMVAFCSNSKMLRRIVFTLCALSGFLGLWALTHSGFGPGGTVGDENDLCLVLLMLLPFCVLMFPVMNSFIFKMTALGCLALTLGGVVASQSRGGFIGLVLAGIYLVLKSKRKFLFLLGGALVVFCALPFVPQQYLSEIESISLEESTAQERINSWRFATRVWLIPRNIPMGTGLQNTPWWLVDVEDAERGISIKSLAGRQTHSAYFQVLGDLGLWGIYIFFMLFWYSRKGLKAAEKGSVKAQNDLAMVRGKLMTEERKAPSDENKSRLKLAATLEQELLFLSAISRSTIVSWIGAGAAAAFISVAYYPSTWVLIGLSATIGKYSDQIFLAVRTLREQVITEGPVKLRR